MDQADHDRPSPVGGALRGAPLAAPCAVVLALAAWWAADGGGFAVSRWAPGGLVLVGLLIVAVAGVPARRRAVPVPVRVAVAALAGYGAWSFASVAWAADRGAAWEGATRTLLYVVAFALFAWWPQRGGVATALVAGWVAAVGVVAGVTAVRLAGEADPGELFRALRLTSPTGYYNATAALFLMPLLPAACLAAAGRLPWWVRGGCAGLAVLFGALGLLCVSRGAAFTLPLAVVAVLLLVPFRWRLVLVLLPIGAALAALTPGLLDVGDALEAGSAAGELDTAMRRTGLAAVLVAVVVGGALAVLGRRPLAPPVAARLARNSRGAGAVALVCVAVGGLAVVGNPVDRIDAAWASFKGGYADNAQEGNRLVGGLGSNRYDFYRVSLAAFGDHPLAGVGADGFFQEYLREGRSEETPRYPHSWQLRTLAQTGSVGALLLLTALGAALVAAWRGMRAGGGAGAAAAGGTAAATYWLAHGSVDWFWEWAGLGVPAFALLGLACGQAPRDDGAAARGRSGGVATPGPARDAAADLRPRLVAAAACGLLAVPFVSVWIASAEQRAAGRSFGAGDVAAAYRHVARAERFDPFSAAPARLEGTIALRRNDLARADAAFGAARERVPDDQYATLEQGAIASARSDRRRALLLLRRAAALAPRDPLTREALGVVRRGATVDVTELNRRILEGTRELGG